MVRPPHSLPSLHSLTEQLASDMGLDFSGDKQDRLKSALKLSEKVNAAGGEDGESGSDPLSILLPHLVVGETYFQRDPETLQALQTHYLGPLIEERRRQGRYLLRLWSAACCTGEEAYTLLFALADMLGDEFGEWQIELLATDLNPAFIAHAQRGRYGEYAFRQSPPAWRARYFTPRGKEWQLQPSWQDKVQFKVHNLAQTQAMGPAAYFDLILCRNVLMYFTPKAVAEVLASLLHQKAKHGHLILAAAEAGLAKAAGWEGELFGQGYAVTDRRIENKAPSAKQPERRQAPAAKPLLPPTVPGSKAHAPRPTSPPRNAKDKPAKDEVEARIMAIRNLADTGQATEAQQACRALIEFAPMVALPYWLLALSEFEAGHHEAVLPLLQKLRYLEPEFALAPYLEAQAHMRAGRMAQAEKAKWQCLQILSKLADDAWIAEGDGLSAAQLRQLCLALEIDTP